jgi:hypothetical protein
LAEKTDEFSQILRGGGEQEFVLRASLHGQVVAQRRHSKDNERRAA